MGPLQRILSLMRDPRTPRLPRLAVLFAVGYILWPADLLPDFVPPLIGWIDDLMVSWLAVRWVFRSAPKEADPVGVTTPDDRALEASGELTKKDG